FKRRSSFCGCAFCERFHTNLTTVRLTRAVVFFVPGLGHFRVQNPFYVGLDGQELAHLVPGAAVFWIQFFLLVQHLCIRSVQLLHLGQLLQSQLVKGIFGRLVQSDLLPVGFQKLFAVSRFAVSHIGIAGLGILDDVRPQGADFFHSLFRCLDLCLQIVVPFSRCRSLCRKGGDRKSTRLNSSHVSISYAVFCLKKKNVSYR